MRKLYFIIAICLFPMGVWAWGLFPISGSVGVDTVQRLDSASSNADSQTLSYTVSAGTNRLLVVSITKMGGAFATGVNYGTQSMTAQIQTGQSTVAVCEIWTLDDAGIAAASNSTITVESGTATNRTIHAASYKNVNQSTPVPETSGAYDHTAPIDNPISTVDIVAGDGSAVASIAYHNYKDRTVTWGAHLTEQTETTNASTGTGSMADGIFGTGQTVEARPTWNFNDNNVGLAAIEISKAP